MSEQTKREKTYAATSDLSSTQSEYEVTTERVKDVTTKHIYDTLGCEKSLEKKKQKMTTTKKCIIVCSVLVPCLIISLIARHNGLGFFYVRVFKK